jgi:hypothetical protein
MKHGFHHNFDYLVVDDLSAALEILWVDTEVN